MNRMSNLANVIEQACSSLSLNTYSLMDVLNYNQVAVLQVFLK